MGAILAVEGAHWIGGDGMEVGAGVEELFEAVAHTGGAIGIGNGPAAAGRGVGDVARAFAAAYATLSDPAVVTNMRAIDADYDPLEHIALGLAFDGSVSLPFDTGDLAQQTAALAGVPIPCGPPPWVPVPTECTEPLFDAHALRLIFGATACGIFALHLPGGGPEVDERICAPSRTSGPSISGVPHTAHVRPDLL